MALEWVVPYEPSKHIGLSSSVQYRTGSLTAECYWRFCVTVLIYVQRRPLTIDTDDLLLGSINIRKLVDSNEASGGHAMCG